MKLLLKGHLAACCLLIATLLLDCFAQEVADGCFNKFKKGQDDFILDTDESVKDGATFLSSPKLGRYRDCVGACCKDPKCNVAFMERGEQEGSISSCFLFDCLYKMKYVCRFVRKKGFTNFIQDDVYESYLSVDQSPSKSQPDQRFCNGRCWSPFRSSWWAFVVFLETMKWILIRGGHSHVNQTVS